MEDSLQIIVEKPSNLRKASAPPKHEMITKLLQKLKNKKNKKTPNKPMSRDYSMISHDSKNNVQNNLIGKIISRATSKESNELRSATRATTAAQVVVLEPIDHNESLRKLSHLINRLDSKSSQAYNALNNTYVSKSNFQISNLMASQNHSFVETSHRKHLERPSSNLEMREDVYNMRHLEYSRFVPSTQPSITSNQVDTKIGFQGVRIKRRGRQKVSNLREYLQTQQNKLVDSQMPRIKLVQKREQKEQINQTARLKCKKQMSTLSNEEGEMTIVEQKRPRSQSGTKLVQKETETTVDLLGIVMNEIQNENKWNGFVQEYMIKQDQRDIQLRLISAKVKWQWIKNRIKLVSRLYKEYSFNKLVRLRQERQDKEYKQMVIEKQEKKKQNKEEAIQKLYEMFQQKQQLKQEVENRHSDMVAKVKKLQSWVKMLKAKSGYEYQLTQIVKIQQMFRMKTAKLKLQELRLQQQQSIKRQQLKQKQDYIQNIKLQKKSVETIQKHRINQLKRRELRKIRQLLWKYPYECRALYFKFIQVKRDTNSLIDEFSQFLVDNNANKEMELLQLRYF